MCDRIKDPSGHWDHDNVVNHRPHVVLLYAPEREARQVQRYDNVFEVRSVRTMLAIGDFVFKMKSSNFGIL